MADENSVVAVFAAHDKAEGAGVGDLIPQREEKEMKDVAKTTCAAFVVSTALALGAAPASAQDDVRGSVVAK